jgi:hypothetical protein
MWSDDGAGAAFECRLIMWQPTSLLTCLCTRTPSTVLCGLSDACSSSQVTRQWLLLLQVVLHLYQEALEKVPFFRGQHPQLITSVITFLKLEYYAPVSAVASCTAAAAASVITATQ